MNSWTSTSRFNQQPLVQRQSKLSLEAEEDQFVPQEEEEQPIQGATGTAGEVVAVLSARADVLMDTGLE